MITPEMAQRRHWQDTAAVFLRVKSTPELRSGKPCVSLRVPVSLVIDHLLRGRGGLEELRANYPDVTEADMKDAVAFTLALLGEIP